MSYYREREEDLENLLNKGALWAVTYGDLMSYLMIFFLIMFTFSIKGKNASEGLSALQVHFGGEKNSAAIQRLRQKGQETVLAEEFQKKFQTKVTEEKIQITLSAKVLYDSGKTDLKPGVFPVLTEFALLVKNLPNSIVVEGHTDDVPVHGEKYSSNFELSMARAYSVVRYLIEKEGLDPKQLSGAGYGEYRPVSPNDTAENRALNRRIEINLIRAR